MESLLCGSVQVPVLLWQQSCELDGGRCQCILRDVCAMKCGASCPAHMLTLASYDCAAMRERRGAGGLVSTEIMQAARVPPLHVIKALQMGHVQRQADRGEQRMRVYEFKSSACSYRQDVLSRAGVVSGGTAARLLRMT